MGAALRSVLLGLVLGCTRPPPPTMTTPRTPATPPPAPPASPTPGDATQRLVEADGTEWTITLGPKTSAPSHEEQIFIVSRRVAPAPPVEVVRLTSGSAIQDNPTMSSSSEWRFFIAGDGGFRAERRTELSTDGSRGVTPTTTTQVQRFRFDGTSLVEVPH